MEGWSVASFFCCLFVINFTEGTANIFGCQNQPLLISYNPKTRIHLAYNETAATVPVWDYVHNISSMYNGRTGAALAFNYETGVSYYIPPGSNITWLSSKTSFNSYFDELPPQTEIYHYGETHGIRFWPSTITEQISEEMAQILSTLSPEYDKQCEALATYLYASKANANYMKTSMIDYQEVVKQFEAPLRGDFKWLIGVYQGIGKFFQAFPGGMSTIASKNITLDMSEILKQNTGIHILIHFLKQFSKYFEIGHLLSPTLNNPLQLFILLDWLSGHLDYGIDGFFQVVNGIVQYLYNENSIATLETTLRNYATDKRTNGTQVDQQWHSSIQDLLQTLTKLHLDKSLSGLREMLTAIQNNTWRLHGVDMSQILNRVVRLSSCSCETGIPHVLRILQGSDS